MAQNSFEPSDVDVSLGFRQVFDELPIPCLTFDERGRIVTHNRASRLFVRADPSGQPVVRLLAADTTQEEFLSSVVTDVLAGHSCDRLDWHFGALDIHVVCSIKPLYGDDGHVTGGMLSCLDVTAQRRYEEQIADQLVKLGDYSVEIEQNRAELAAANRQLQALATTDSMTGLLNRRAFQDMLSKEIKRALRHGTPFTLMLLDVDDFKTFNDRFGHQAGDEVLIEVGSILRKHARETDTVARYGGEEFIVILSGAHVEGSLIAAERFRAAIEGGSWPRRQITGSFGLATFSSGMTPDELISIADEALYACKADGKNRVSHGNPLGLSLAA